MKKQIFKSQMHADPRDRKYWLSRPVEERIAQVEVLRREFYGSEAVEQPMRKDIVRVIRLRDK